MPPRDDASHWLLDKRINVGLVLGMVVQMMGFGWYAAKIDSRVEQLELRTTNQEGRLVTFDKEARDVSIRLIRLEEKTSAVLEILRRIETQVDRQTPARRTELPSRTTTE